MFQEKLRLVMSLDGESLFSIAKCVHLLLLAKVILLDLHENFGNIQVSHGFIFYLSYIIFKIFVFIEVVEYLVIESYIFVSTIIRREISHVDFIIKQIFG